MSTDLSSNSEQFNIKKSIKMFFFLKRLFKKMKKVFKNYRHFGVQTGKMSKYQYSAFIFLHLRSDFHLLVQKHLKLVLQVQYFSPLVREGFTRLGFP